jgi:hypothetical protein
VCELGLVYLSLTKALANGTAATSLGVPIESINAKIE